MSVLGYPHYYAGESGAVELGKGEPLLGLWCVATSAGGTVTVDGGPPIPLVPGIPFSFALESLGEEWSGITITFAGTASYFVKTKRRLRT